MQYITLHTKYYIHRREQPVESRKSNVDYILWLVCLMVFHATFNNILVISWLSVLVVEETGLPGENHRPVAIH